MTSLAEKLLLDTGAEILRIMGCDVTWWNGWDDSDGDDTLVNPRGAITSTDGRRFCEYGVCREEMGKEIFSLCRPLKQVIQKLTVKMAIYKSF